MAPAQIFISYSHGDRLAVDRLFNDLSRRRCTLGMDIQRTGIPPGSAWQEELRKQLHTSEVLLACISPSVKALASGSAPIACHGKSTIVQVLAALGGYQLTTGTTYDVSDDKTRIQLNLNSSQAGFDGAS